MPNPALLQLRCARVLERLWDELELILDLLERDGRAPGDREGALHARAEALLLELALLADPQASATGTPLLPAEHAMLAPVVGDLRTLLDLDLGSPADDAWQARLLAAQNRVLAELERLTREEPPVTGFGLARVAP